MGHEVAFDSFEKLLTPVCNLCSGYVHHRVFSKGGYDLVRCADCDLVFVANPPDGQVVEAFYSAASDCPADLPDADSPAFARMQAIAARHLRVLSKLVSPQTGARLLDIGCSTGLFLDRARAAGFDVCGAELSPDTARFAAEHFGLAVHRGNWREAGHADHSFDVITLFDVLEHLPDPLAELAAIRRLLKPDGILLQSSANIDGLFPRLSYRLARWLDYWPHPQPPHRLYQFSVHTLTEMTALAGYEPFYTDQARIGLDYSFGTAKGWRARPRRLAYAIVFAPSAMIGPWLGMGDCFYLAARNAPEVLTR